jgi:hypothetical protein
MGKQNNPSKKSNAKPTTDDITDEELDSPKPKSKFMDDDDDEFDMPIDDIDEFDVDYDEDDDF